MCFIRFNLQFWSDWICQFSGKKKKKSAVLKYCHYSAEGALVFYKVDSYSSGVLLNGSLCFWITFTSSCLPLQDNSRAHHPLLVSCCCTSCHCNTGYEQTVVWLNTQCFCVWLFIIHIHIQVVWSEHQTMCCRFPWFLKLCFSWVELKLWEKLSAPLNEHKTGCIFFKWEEDCRSTVTPFIYKTETHLIIAFMQISSICAGAFIHLKPRKLTHVSEKMMLSFQECLQMDNVIFIPHKQPLILLLCSQACHFFMCFFPLLTPYQDAWVVV